MARARRSSAASPGRRLGRLVTLKNGQMLAAVATEHGVWVVQSGQGRPLRRPAPADPAGQMPETLAAAWLGGESTIVAWTAATGVAGAAAPRSISYAVGSRTRAPRRQDRRHRAARPPDRRARCGRARRCCGRRLDRELVRQERGLSLAGPRDRHRAACHRPQPVARQPAGVGAELRRGHRRRPGHRLGVVHLPGRLPDAGRRPGRQRLVRARPHAGLDRRLPGPRAGGGGPRAGARRLGARGRPVAATASAPGARSARRAPCRPRRSRSTSPSASAPAARRSPRGPRARSTRASWAPPR